MVVDAGRVIEDEMHFILECPSYVEDRNLLFDKLRMNLLFEKLRIEPELVDKDLSMTRAMNLESFEGWKYLINFIKNTIIAN